MISPLTQQYSPQHLTSSHQGPGTSHATQVAHSPPKPLQGAAHSAPFLLWFVTIQAPPLIHWSWIVAIILQIHPDPRGQTYEVFDRITTAAGGADQVQQEIAKVLDDSREKLADVNGSLEREKAEYDTVCLHIERANDLGTQKSTMFENMENLLVQIAPIAKELERKNWWHYFTKTDWQKNNIVYIYISGIF